MWVSAWGLIPWLSERALSWHCIRSPDSMHVHICFLCLMFCLSSQLSPDDYREHAYTCMPEEVDTDVSSVLHSSMTWCSIQLSIMGHNSFLFFCFLFRPNLAGCVSRIKWWGHRRTNFSSYTERRWLNAAHLSSLHYHTKHCLQGCGARWKKNKLKRIYSLHTV